LFNELGNESSPSSLVTRSNPSPVVAMEVLVKIDEARQLITANFMPTGIHTFTLAT